jgi:hypothetical protein
VKLLDKKVPDKAVIDFLTKEIKEYALPFAKEYKPFNFTKMAFDSLKIPSTLDNVERSGLVTGTYQMDRTRREPETMNPNIKGVIDHLKVDECTNLLYYAANSVMTWHTNSENPGKRIYILYTSRPGIFRYKDPYTGEIIDDYDYIGWTQREFIVHPEKLLWHCVYSPAPRFSYGFNVKNVDSF